MTDIDVDPDLIATVRSLFTEISTHEAVMRAESEGLPQQLWATTAELGLPLVGIDESAGGSGGTLLDAAAIIEAAAEFAVPLPLRETYLAAWLLSGAGLPIPDRPLAVAPGHSDDAVTVGDSTASGVLHDVAWARGAAAIVALIGREVICLDPADCAITPGTDLAGQPRDVVHFQNAPVASAVSAYSADQFFLRGALITAAQIAGALTGVFVLTRQYVGERVQFGRPIGRFQAVQRHTVTLAQAATMTSLSVARAARAAIDGPAAFEICSAKWVADQNATEAYRAAHQAHGAIGMTQECRLQQLTRRLLSWRGEFGDERTLGARIGEAITRAGTLAPVITGGSCVLPI